MWSALTSHYLFQLLLQNQGVYFRQLLKAVKKKKSQISSFQVTREALSLLHTVFLQGLPPHAWPPSLAGALICSGHQPGAGPLGAALAPNKPLGMVSVCPRQLCVRRCLITDLHKWFSHCGVKSCHSDPQLTCDSVWCELLASAAPASVCCLVWWSLSVFMWLCFSESCWIDSTEPE